MHLVRSPHSDYERQRILDVSSDCLQEFRAGCPVDDAVIAAHRHADALTELELAVDHDGLLLDAADRKNARFRRIDDRGELIDPEHAEVGDGEGGPGVLLGEELPLARSAGEIARLLRDVPQRHSIRVEQNGRDKTVLNRDCHRHMNPIEMTDLVVQPVRVYLGMLGERECDCPDDNVVEGDLVLISHFRQLRAQFGSAGRIELGGEEESRYRTVGLGEPTRNSFPDLREWHVLEIAFRRKSLGSGRASGSHASRSRVLDVALDDAAAWARSLNSAELDSFLGSKPAGEWRRTLTSARRRRARSACSISFGSWWTGWSRRGSGPRWRARSRTTAGSFLLRRS